ncbi:hypothetical protein ILUMI_14848, partial [Ignelater luminosus]
TCKERRRRDLASWTWYSSGTGLKIANSIFQYISESHNDLNILIAIGCNGTATNTGWINRKQLTGCKKLAVVKFEPIPSKKILVTKTDLRKDQLYLQEIVQAMQTRECSGCLAAKKSRLSFSLSLVNLCKSYYKLFPNWNVKVLARYTF